MTVLSASCKVTASLTRSIVKTWSRSIRPRAVLLDVALLVVLAMPAAAQEGRRRRVGAASHYGKISPLWGGLAALSGHIAPLWAAREAGIFKKNGLDIDLIAFPAGTEGMAAMIAG